jgi:hypothetical protein
VEKHGGTLTVNSCLGEGSEFVISIPGWRVSSRSLAQLAPSTNLDPIQSFMPIVVIGQNIGFSKKKPTDIPGF